MHERKTTPERLGAFSDAVIAVLITIMVLELEAPEEATFQALLPLWPTAVSYAGGDRRQGLGAPTHDPFEAAAPDDRAGQRMAIRQS